jgi:futalosine hydrolase
MSRSLILVPTDYELAQLGPRFTSVVESVGDTVAICGFGPIASGICTVRLLAKHSPHSVILVGIAGALNPSAKIGTAEVFSNIGCYGIGAGGGSDFKTASELGWNQWTEPESGQTFDDTIRLNDTANETNTLDSMLLTVCAASASPVDVIDRLRKFPNAVAEDMEAFSVAMACRMAGIPLTVIRGISNIAGDRNKANWHVADALEAATELTIAKLLS